MIINLKIQRCRAKYAEYKKKRVKIYIRMDNSKNAMETEKHQDELRVLDQEFDEFVCNVYARAVFEEYAHRNPELVVASTNEAVAWNDVFGIDFDKLSKLRKFSLVYLIEGGGKYKLK